MTGAATVIRQAEPADRGALDVLYPRAFPEEDLLALIAGLWDDPSRPLMLVAERGGDVIGHIAFSPCTIAGRPERVSLLGPLAVDPDHQRNGVGRSLIEAGLEMLGRDGCGAVFVLGDPAYYARFGFLPNAPVAPPYPLPEEWRDAWQYRIEGAQQKLAGTLTVPACWQDPALWSD